MQRVPFRDWGFKVGTAIKLELSQDKFDVNEEFIHVTMNTSRGMYEAFHAQVIPKQEVLRRAKKRGGLPLNIMIVGFDSLSTAQFRVSSAMLDHEQGRGGDGGYGRRGEKRGMKKKGKEENGEDGKKEEVGEQGKREE